MATWHEQDRFWETVPMFGEPLLEVAPEQVNAALALLGIEPGAALLDLCCGVGRHSLALAQRRYRVTGVDRTAAYLRTACEKAAVLGVRLELVQADMRDFVRPGAFDGAINLFSSFGYFEDPADDLKVAQNLFRSLKPGCRLVMELMGKEVLARIFAPRDWQQTLDGTILLQGRSVTRDWTWMEGRWIVVRPVDLFGSLGGEPYDTEAQRLVAVAHKPGG